MKTTHSAAILFFIFFFVFSCKKTEIGSNSYIPTASDATANATLDELQQGRTIFIANCAACHNLPSPDDYSVAQWTNILSTMTPKTNLTTSQTTLIKKYVTRGQ